MNYWIAYAVIALVLLAVFIRNEYADRDKPSSTVIGQCIMCAALWPVTVPIGLAMVLGERFGRAARKRKLAQPKPDGEKA